MARFVDDGCITANCVATPDRKLMNVDEMVTLGMTIQVKSWIGLYGEVKNKTC